MSKRQFFFYQYESPNIVIQPTVNFSPNNPSDHLELHTPKKQKLEHATPELHQHSQPEQTCEQTAEQSVSCVQNIQNTLKVSLAKDLLETQYVTERIQTSPSVAELNENCDSYTNPKQQNSWASNYMMSIGESYKKPIKLNLSLSRKNERVSKEGISVNNKIYLDNHVSMPKSNDEVLNPKDINEKSNVKSLSTHKAITKWECTTSTKSEDLKILPKITYNLGKTPDYKINSHIKYVALNDCNVECMDTNVPTPKCTKEIILNRKEATITLNPTSSNTYDKFNLTNSNTCTQTGSQDSNLFSSTDYKNDRYIKHMALNDCNEECMATNNLTPNSTKEMTLNHEEATTFNLTSSYTYDKLNSHNVNTCIQTSSQYLNNNLSSNTVNLTNPLSLKPLLKPNQNSVRHNPTYKREYKSINQYKNDYFNVNLNNESSQNKNGIIGATTEYPKYESNSDVGNSKNRVKRITNTSKGVSNSDFENINHRYKSQSKSPKCASKHSSFSNGKISNKYKSEAKSSTYSSSKSSKYLSEISRSSEVKYRTRTASDSSITSPGHSEELEECKLYEIHKENTDSRYQPKSDSKPILRNRRRSEATSNKKYSKNKNPDFKKETIKSSVTRENDSENKHENKEQKNTTSLKKNPASKNKKELENVKNKSKSKTKLKSVSKSPSRTSRSSKNKDKISQGFYDESQQSIPTKSKAQSIENVELNNSDALKFSKGFDLRQKLSSKRVSLNDYFSKLRSNGDKNYLKVIPKNRENLKITVENDVDEEDIKSEDISSDEVTTPNQAVLQFKQINLVINVIQEKPVSKPTNTEDECNDKENENCALNSEDLSFLDDFNVDEIVESLNQCQSDSEMNDISEEFFRINNDEDLLTKSPNSIIDGDRIRNSPDIHNEETMDLTEIKEKENVTEIIINKKTTLDDRRSCIQEYIVEDPILSLSLDQTMLLDEVKVNRWKNEEIDPIIKVQSSAKDPQEDSNIVLKDNNDYRITLKETEISENLNNFRPENLLGNVNTTLFLHSEENRHRANEKENHTPLLDNIKIEPNAKGNTLGIPNNKIDNNTPLIDNIKIEPSTEDNNMIVTVSENEIEDNTLLTDSIKVESSTETNHLNTMQEFFLEKEENVQINDVSGVKKLNTNLTDTENVHAKDALDTIIKLEPTESRMVRNLPLGDVGLSDTINEISISMNSEIQSTINEVKETKNPERSEELLNNNKPKTNVVTSPSSNLDQMGVSIDPDNVLSDETIVENSTNTIVEDMSIVISEDEESVALSLDLNDEEMCKETMDEKFVTKTLKVKTTTSTTDPNSSSILSGLLNSKPDEKDIEIKRTLQILSLEGADKYLVENLEKRMLKYLQDKYTVTSYIHKGQFSKIFKCTNTRGKNYVAKVVITKKRFHLGFQKEKMLMQLQMDIPKDNFNFVFIYNGFGIKDGWCFLSEYCPKNLTEALNESIQPFHIDLIQELSRQLVAAVTVLRNNNVVHSDIKPHHILLNSSNNRLKLCGFDAAYYVGTVDVLPNIGTVNYRAPELILGYSADFSIDVWSTALVMFEMATKRQLFPGMFNNDILFKQMCTLGNLTCEMIQNSLFRDKHFDGMVFKRRTGFKGQSIVFWENFKKNFRLTKGIFKAYNFWNTETAFEQRKKDLNKLTMFRKLLEQMLMLHPNQRIAIEFVYSNPFIHDTGNRDVFVIDC